MSRKLTDVWSGDDQGSDLKHSTANKMLRAHGLNGGLGVFHLRDLEWNAEQGSIGCLCDGNRSGCSLDGAERNENSVSTLAEGLEFLNELPEVSEAHIRGVRDANRCPQMHRAGVDQRDSDFEGEPGGHFPRGDQGERTPILVLQSKPELLPLRPLPRRRSPFGLERELEVGVPTDDQCVLPGESEFSTCSGGLWIAAFGRCRFQGGPDGTSEPLASEPYDPLEKNLSIRNARENMIRLGIELHLHVGAEVGSLERIKKLILILVVRVAADVGAQHAHSASG